MSDEENIETPAMTEEGADSVANPTFHSLPRGGKAFSAKARGKQREMEQPSEENSSPELALASSPEPSLPDPPSPIFAGLYAELEDAMEAEGKIPGSPAAELPGAASTPLLPAAPWWLPSSSRAIVPKAERLEELTIKEPRSEVAIFRTRIETLSEFSDTVENQAWNDGFRGVAIRPEQDEPPPHEDQNIEHYRERIQDFPARLEAVRDEGTAAGAADKEAELRVQIEFDSTRRDRSAAEVVAAYEGELAELRAKTTKVQRRRRWKPMQPFSLSLFLLFCFVVSLASWMTGFMAACLGDFAELASSPAEGTAITYGWFWDEVPIDASEVMHIHHIW